MSVYSRLDLNADQERVDETRKVKHFEDGDFSALRPNYNRRALARHIVTEQNAPQNSIPNFSQDDVQLEKTHCYSNLLNHKTTRYTFHAITHCQWLNKHR